MTVSSQTTIFSAIRIIKFTSTTTYTFGTIAGLNNYGASTHKYYIKALHSSIKTDTVVVNGTTYTNVNTGTGFACTGLYSDFSDQSVAER